jgi:lysophospholipid acyltransferase (LPLAT)-like uncharacterized protein
VEETPDQPRFSRWQRVQIALIAAAVSAAIRLIGSTLRFETSVERGGTSYAPRTVYAFWHQCIFAAAYCFRNKQIAVMTSRSFDGEYIARIIERFGFRAVRGSSSRAAAAALLGMHDELAAGHAVAFTIDGPRGPKFIAKPGPILLAKNEQTPLIVFHVACERAWRLSSWDEMMIPKPFSRCVVRFSSAITLPPEATREQMDAAHGEMQAALERVQRWAIDALRCLPATAEERI